jgi:hypothetical protein
MKATVSLYRLRIALIATATSHTPREFNQEEAVQTAEKVLFCFEQCFKGFEGAGWVSIIRTQTFLNDFARHSRHLVKKDAEGEKLSAVLKDLITYADLGTLELDFTDDLWSTLRKEISNAFITAASSEGSPTQNATPKGVAFFLCNVF